MGALTLALSTDTAGQGVGSAVDLITRNGALTVDGAEAGAQLQYRVGTSSSWSNSYGANNTLNQVTNATVRFSFTEAPVGFTLADAVVTGGASWDGALSEATTDAATGSVYYTAVLKPKPLSTDDAVVTIPEKSFTDAAGNPNPAAGSLTVKVNLALNKTVSASSYSVFAGGYSAAGVVDGNLARVAGYASSVATTDNWLQIDLGQNLSIADIRLTALSSSAQDMSFLVGVSVYVSTQALSSLSAAQLQAGDLNAVRVGVSTTATYQQQLSVNGWGTGATVTAMDPVTVGSTVYAQSFRVKPGAGASYSTDSTFTIGSASVVDTAGAAAGADVRFRMTDVVAPPGTTPPIAISVDNLISAAERSAATSLTFTSPVNADTGDVMKVYRDGVEVKTVSMTVGTTSTSFTLSGNDWGSADSVVGIAVRIQDAAGNLGPLSPVKLTTVDTVTAMALIWEDLVPRRERRIGRDRDALALVALSDQF